MAYDRSPAGTSLSGRPDFGSLLDVARRVVWFKPPERALEDEVFFLNHVMIYGTTDDIVLTRRDYDDGAFRNVLRNAHPGIWDRKSWAWWHVVLDLLPASSVPVRIPEVDDSLKWCDSPPRTTDNGISLGWQDRDAVRRMAAAC